MLHSSFANPDVSIGLVYDLPAGSGYNVFELRFDPISQNADLFVDGVERISNFGGISEASAAGVYWGALSAIDTGRGNFNAVTFMTTVPEASGFLLVGAAGCAIIVAWRARRFRAGPIDAQ